MAEQDAARGDEKMEFDLADMHVPHIWADKDKRPKLTPAEIINMTSFYVHSGPVPEWALTEEEKEEYHNNNNNDDGE